MPTTSNIRRRRISFLLRRRFFLVITVVAMVPFGIGYFLANLEVWQASAASADPSKVEAGEEFPGGDATSRKSNQTRNAFSKSSGNLNFKRELNFKVGNGIFKKIWVSAPASTKASDGLGPLYNARSCQRCHLKDGRGHPPKANWPEDDSVSMFLRLSIPPETEEQKALLASHKLNVIPEPTYGGQLQDLSVQGHDAEGKMHITYEEVPVELSGGEHASLRKPTYKVENLGYGPLHPKVMLSPRIAPQMLGLGLLEAIPEAQILANEDKRDKDSDGISGQAQMVWSVKTNKAVLGRFGWKAGNPTVAQQSAGAFAGDMGLSNPLVKGGFGECTQKQTFCRNAPNGETERYSNLEVGQEMFDLVVFYAQNLAVPKRRDHDAPDVLRGKEIFNMVGCSSCHQPKFKTGKLDGAPHLSGQLIWPYTDLLLHDMGEGLADNRPEGVANGQEWRTAPLWGIGLTPIVNGHSFYLHDGRARNLLEAILWHGGEAQAARDAVTQISPEERADLIRFVGSL